MRYKFIKYTNSSNKKITICVSKYAGKSVKGVSVCFPEDVYNEELGEQISTCRCDQKIETKRMNNMITEALQIEDTVDSLLVRYNKLCNKIDESKQKLNTYSATLSVLLPS